MPRIAGHEIGMKATAQRPATPRGDANEIARLVKAVRTRRPSDTGDEIMDQQLTELGRMIRKTKALARLAELPEGQALIASLAERAEKMRQRLPVLEVRRSRRAQSYAIEIVLLDGIAHELSLLCNEHKRATRFFGIAKKLRLKRRHRKEELNAEG